MIKKYIFAVLMGYLLGSLNPAALISKIKHRNIRKSGTGNLGATNVLLNFGKRFAAAVMLFDVAKAFAAYKLAEAIAPEAYAIGMIAGIAAVLGHIFPFYLKFKGGKGLASFGGLVLAYDPLLFLFLIVTGVIIMVIVNYSFALPFWGGIAFPIFVGLKEQSPVMILLATAISVLIIVMHFGNMIKAKNGTDNKIREYIKKLTSK